jgi:hypothetical protein
LTTTDRTISHNSKMKTTLRATMNSFSGELPQTTVNLISLSLAEKPTSRTEKSFLDGPTPSPGPMMEPMTMVSFFRKTLKMKKMLRSLSPDGSPPLTMVLATSTLLTISRLDTMSQKDPLRRITVRPTLLSFTESQTSKTARKNLAGLTHSHGQMPEMLTIPSFSNRSTMNLKALPRRITEKLTLQLFTVSPTSKTARKSQDGPTLSAGTMMDLMTIPSLSD